MASIEDLLSERDVLSEINALYNHLELLPPNGASIHKLNTLRQHVLIDKKALRKSSGAPIDFHALHDKDYKLYDKITRHIVEAWISYGYTI